MHAGPSRNVLTLLALLALGPTTALAAPGPLATYPQGSFNGSGGVSLGKGIAGQMAGDFTIELSVKPAATQVTHADILDLNHRDKVGIVIQQKGDEQNRFIFAAGDGNSGAAIEYPLRAEAWQRVVFQRRGTELTLRVDGRVVASSPCFSGPVHFLPDSEVTVAYNKTYGRAFRGEIQGLALYGYARDGASASEPVAVLREGTFNGSGGSTLGRDFVSRLTGDFTIELSVRPGATQVTHADILDFNHRDKFGIVIQQKGDEQNRFVFAVGDGTRGAALEHPLQAGVWQRLSFQRKGTELTLRVDGRVVASGPCFPGPVRFLPDSEVTVGYNKNYGRHFRGEVKDLRIWSDAHEHGVASRPAGPSAIAVFEHGRFDGSGGSSLGRGPVQQMTGDFSIELSVKPAATQVTHADILDFNHRDKVGIVIQQKGDEQNRFIFAAGDGSSGAAIEYQLRAETWQRLVFQRRGTELTLFVDGKLVGSTPCFAGPVRFLPDSEVTVGFNKTYGRQFRGEIKDLLLFPAAREL